MPSTLGLNSLALYAGLFHSGIFFVKVICLLWRPVIAPTRYISNNTPPRTHISLDRRCSATGDLPIPEDTAPSCERCLGFK